MTQKQKSEIIRMRTMGKSFSKISEITGVSRNTIKSFCRRNSITIKFNMPPDDLQNSMYCKECGKKLTQNTGKKKRKFCSAQCRVKWWNSHPEEVNRKAIYIFKCHNCGRHFTSYGNRNRKFCSHRCYIANRFRNGGSNEPQ